MVTIKRAVRYYIWHRIFECYSVQTVTTSFIDVFVHFAQKVSTRKHKKSPFQTGTGMFQIIRPLGESRFASGKSAKSGCFTAQRQGFCSNDSRITDAG